MSATNKLDSATWDSLTEQQPLETRTVIEQLPVEDLPPALRFWRENGYVIVPGMFSRDELLPYKKARALLPRGDALDNYVSGWSHPTPYMDCSELCDLATNPGLLHVLQSLIGEPMGLHLALTGYVSTERNWHQDSYLNPSYLWSHYAAAWIALDKVTADAGPFEFYPGSHLWPTLRRDKLFEYLTPEERNSPDWPTFTQDKISALIEGEADKHPGLQVCQFLPEEGDVLIWHSNLVHRGSPPLTANARRKAVICHYSALTRRLDMHRIARNPNTGGLYFDLPSSGRVRMLRK